jgi:hypothetical protein
MTHLDAKSLGVLVCATLSNLAVPDVDASIFSGPAFFSVAPYTQMGTSANLLAINTLNPLGYNVAGQFIVNVPAGAVSGTLLRYEVRRPLNLSFGSQSVNVLQYLIGFSQPPAGTYGNSSGYCRTYLDVGGQFANSNLNLTNGAQTWNWNVQGPFFNYTSGTDLFLVQEFELDGVKLGGPAGQWIIDLPVDSLLSPVPEPATLGLLVGAGLLTLRRGR